jgi:hypothetical protein
MRCKDDDNRREQRNHVGTGDSNSCCTVFSSSSYLAATFLSRGQYKMVERTRCLSIDETQIVHIMRNHGGTAERLVSSNQRFDLEDVLKMDRHWVWMKFLYCDLGTLVVQLSIAGSRGTVGGVRMA